MSAEPIITLVVVTQHRDRLAEEVQAMRQTISRLVAEVEVEAHRLVARERDEGAEAADTSSISARLGELGSLRADVLLKQAELVERTRTVELVRSVLGPGSSAQGGAVGCSP